MHPPISANTLFHFTDSLDNLIGILQDTFRPRHCLEDYNLLRPAGQDRDPLYEWSYPMVCFCDLPLTMIRANHLKTYGHYGIGMTKDWGIKNGISPVFYAYENCLSINSLQWLFTVTRSDNSVAAERVTTNFFKLMCFMKPYSGNLVRRGRTTRNVRFYNEREWRYVPDINSATGVRNLEKDEFLTPETLASENQKVAALYRIPFSPSDIRYLVLRYKKDIIPLIDAVGVIKEKFSPNEVAVLKSRILTTKQLVEDF